MADAGNGPLLRVEHLGLKRKRTFSIPEVKHERKTRCAGSLSTAGPTPAREGDPAAMIRYFYDDGNIIVSIGTRGFL
jgi:hypothetical protein